MSIDDLPEWERLLSSAARLQRLVPEAVLVGGTAASLHARHRFSHDADHVVSNLRSRFDRVLAQLESVAGWKTARVQRPVLILGSLDGIETGIRQLIRERPLETTRLKWAGKEVVVPTLAEILRIKGLLILKRNATRDYLDFVALADRLGKRGLADALQYFDEIYPQPNDESALQQLQVQLANPMPYDLEETRLAEYKSLDPKWHDWSRIKDVCADLALFIFDRVGEAGPKSERTQTAGGKTHAKKSNRNSTGKSVDRRQSPRRGPRGR